MFATHPIRSALRLSWVGYLVFAFLAVQGLGVHIHTFADHDSTHGHDHHDHAIEFHVGGMPTDSGHDDLASEAALGRLAILKIKIGQASMLALVAAPLLFILALAGPLPWRPARQRPPAPRGDVRTPPLRAPPV